MINCDTCLSEHNGVCRMRQRLLSIPRLKESIEAPRIHSSIINGGEGNIGSHDPYWTDKIILLTSIVYAINALDAEKRAITWAYYCEGKRQCTIGDVLHISQARVSQVLESIDVEVCEKMNGGSNVY